MAAGFAMSKANIEGPDGASYPKATIQVRSNVLTIKVKGNPDPVVFDQTVQSAVRTDRAHWTVTTSKGVFTVERDKDCGCGGR